MVGPTFKFSSFDVKHIQKHTFLALMPLDEVEVPLMLCYGEVPYVA